MKPNTGRKNDRGVTRTTGNKNDFESPSSFRQVWTDFTQALLMLDNFTLARELKTFRGRRQELTASMSRTKRREALSMPPSSEEEPSHPNANRGMNTLPLDAQSEIKKQLRTA
jgi:hypothetical protein